IIMFLSIIFVFIKITKREVKYIKSDIDGREYLVRDLDDKQKASNMLARVRFNLVKLTDYLVANKNKYNKEKVYIDRLAEKIYTVTINESSEDSMYTSYSVNKGEQLVFCLRSKYYINKIHDLNLIMYVALHEIAHIACPEYGHTDLFKK